MIIRGTRLCIIADHRIDGVSLTLSDVCILPGALLVNVLCVN